MSIPALTLGLGTIASSSDTMTLGLTSDVPDSAIAAAQQRLDVGNYVELFTLDLTSRGGGVLYWTPAREKNAAPIVWQGNTYQTVDIAVSGFDKNTSGSLPRPQFSVGNADNVVGALLTAYNDLCGLNVTRTRTLEEFLDGMPGADPDAEWPIDVYRIERKVSQNKRQVVLELAAITDNEGAQIPKYPILRDLCPLIYRRYVTTGTPGFDYTQATCPYAGTSCFDSLGTAVSSASDRCGKRVSDCKLRFGALSQLPFGGFPGIARVNN